MSAAAAALSARALVAEGAAILRAAGGPAAATEAGWLLACLMSAKPSDLYLRDQQVDAAMAKQYFLQVDARASGTPLQYLMGYEEFFGYRFAVRPGVFIPRPETETVVERALVAFARLSTAGGAGLKLVDAGAGSGCIAITLAKRLPACVVVGIELSWEPLWTARENARLQGVADRVHLVKGQWLKPIHPWVDGIVTNPPYIPSNRIADLPLDVRRQPSESLDGGADGLRDALMILSQAPDVLRPGGCLVMECAEDQVGPLLQHIGRCSWVERSEGFDDLTRRPRGILITRGASPSHGG